MDWGPGGLPTWAGGKVVHLQEVDPWIHGFTVC